jgi:hypothetical protein
MHFLSKVLPLVLALTGSTAAAAVDVSPRATPKTCVVKPRGDQKNDVPNILRAFQKCNNGGRIVFPEGETYWIAERLNPHVRDVTIEWKGTWLVRIPHLVSDFYSVSLSFFFSFLPSAREETETETGHSS